MDRFCYCVCLCHIVTSVSYSLMITCWERADLLAFLYVMCFFCVFCVFLVTFPFGVLVQVWYLIVSIPDICPFLTFITSGSDFLAHRIRISDILLWDRKYYLTHAILPRTSSNTSSCEIAS